MPIPITPWLFNVAFAASPSLTTLVCDTTELGHRQLRRLVAGNAAGKVDSRIPAILTTEPATLSITATLEAGEGDLYFERLVYQVRWSAGVCSVEPAGNLSATWVARPPGARIDWFVNGCGTKGTTPLDRSKQRLWVNHDGCTLVFYGVAEDGRISLTEQSLSDVSDGAWLSPVELNTIPEPRPSTSEELKLLSDNLAALEAACNRGVALPECGPEALADRRARLSRIATASAVSE